MRYICRSVIDIAVELLKCFLMVISLLFVDSEICCAGWVSGILVDPTECRITKQMYFVFGRYDRLDISADDSQETGAHIPVMELQAKVAYLLRTILVTPSCVLEKVVDDPYFEFSDGDGANGDAS
jgi:hypothetical protein